MDQAEAIETEATDEGELDEELLGERLVVILVPVAAHGENLPAVLVDGDDIGQGKLLAAKLLRRKLVEIELAIALVNLVISVARLRGRWIVAVDRRLFLLD